LPIGFVSLHIYKGLPQQAEVAQGVPGMLRPPIFLTFRHYKGGRSSAIRTGLLYPGRNPWYSLSEAESSSGHMVLLGEPRKKFPVTPPGIDPGTVRLVAQCLNHYATQGPLRARARAHTHTHTHTHTYIYIYILVYIRHFFDSLFSAILHLLCR